MSTERLEVSPWDRGVALSRTGCVVNGRTTHTSKKWVRPCLFLPPPYGKMAHLPRGNPHPRAAMFFSSVFFTTQKFRQGMKKKCKYGICVATCYKRIEVVRSQAEIPQGIREYAASATRARLSIVGHDQPFRFDQMLRLSLVLSLSERAATAYVVHVDAHLRHLCIFTYTYLHISGNKSTVVCACVWTCVCAHAVLPFSIGSLLFSFILIISRIVFHFFSLFFSIIYLRMLFLVRSFRASKEAEQRMADMVARDGALPSTNRQVE